MTYAEKLQDPRWQKMRLEILHRDEFTCQNCESNDKTLHVHHKYYLPHTDPWEYPAQSLVTLCLECHELERELEPMKVEFLNGWHHAGFLNVDMEGSRPGVHTKLPRHWLKSLITLLNDQDFTDEVQQLIIKHLRIHQPTDDLPF